LIAAGCRRQEFPDATVLGHRVPVQAVAFAPDSKALAAGGGLPKLPGGVKGWDLATGRKSATLGPSGAVLALAISPHGPTLATAGYDPVVRLWARATGREVRTLRGHASQVWGVAFNPGGQTLATGDIHGTVKLWDLSTGRQRATLEGLDKRVLCFA